MKNILSIILLTLSLSSLAQNKVMFTGEVRDSLGSPLQFANVLAMDTATQTMAAFGVTNNYGEFKLSLTAGTTYTIKVSFIGYLPFERLHTPQESNNVPYRIDLRNDVLTLSDVEVVSEMPVSIQGDTITYKAEVFNQGNERKLEDVLEDLPGFEIDEEGGVKVQGKSVDKVLVDGKEFFDGDTKMATKNLPANVVDKVQVLQNYNDISPLGAVNNNNDRIALNIQLKEDKKNMVFGDLTASGGLQDRYLGHANVFFYNKKTNINLIADANNIGEPAFTMRDYFRFAGGLGNLTRGSGGGFNISSDNLGIPTAERDNAMDLNNQLGAININFNPNKTWRITGFGIGAFNDNLMGSISRRTYILQPNANEETLTSEQNVMSKSGVGKLGITYTPNLNLQIDYKLFGRIADIQNSDIQNSDFGLIVNDIQGKTMQDPSALEQQLRAFYAPNEKDVYSMEASYKYRFQNPTYNLVNTGQPFAGIIPATDNNSPYDLTQTSETTTHSQESVVNYYRILNKTNHINFSFGNVFNRQFFNTGIFETLDNGTINRFTNASLNNEVDYTFQDIYGKVLYKTKLGNLVISPALNFHYFESYTMQNESKDGFNRQYILPSLYAKYNFSNSHSLTLNFNTSADFTDVQNLAQGLRIRSYNSLFQGNIDLRNSIYHNVSLNYGNFNMFNFFNIYGGANYSRRIDDRINIIEFNNLERINLPANINAVNESLSSFLTADKRFDTFRLQFRGNWSSTISNNIIADTPNENINFTQSYRGMVSSTIAKKIYLDLGYDISFRDYRGTNSQGKFINQKPFGSLEIQFLKGLEWETSYEYNAYQNGQGTTVYDLLDSELRYRKEGSAWEFKLQGLNILNTRGIRQDSFSESLISTFEYYIQPRYFMLGVMFDL